VQPLIPIVPGKYHWVDSNTGVDSGEKGRSLQSPYATIDFAIGKCTANKDAIIVLPGHTETISAAGSITADVAGIPIIGLGWGTLRPTLTWSATAGTIAISAANVKLVNFLTTISIDEVVSMIAVSGADCLLDSIDFTPYGALGVTGQALQFAALSAARATIQNCVHRQYTAGNSAQVWITTTAVTGHRILNNMGTILANASTSSHWVGSSAAPTEIEIAGNRVNFLGGTITGLITLTAGSTGIIHDNFLGGGAQVGTATAIVANGCYMFQNYVTETAGSENGILTPAGGTW
jgi:hypothetical protein